MRVISVKAKNFASYKDIELSVDDNGLTLIYGPTGSGKSTIFDVICWALFGVTAKGGSVDSIKSWRIENEITEAKILVETNEGTIKITRRRGKNSQNDLFWEEENSSEQKRGKDLTETQKFIEKRLGVSVDLYLTSAYFSEFSFAASFFLDSSKDRRQVLEKVTDLKLPAVLAEATAKEKKEIKKEMGEHNLKLSNLCGKLDQIESYGEEISRWDEDIKKAIQDLEKKAKEFDLDKSTKLMTLKRKISEFEDKQVILTKACLDHMSSTIKKLEQVPKVQICSACGYAKNEVQLIDLNNDLIRTEEKYNRLLGEINPYLDKYENLQSVENPYISQIEYRKSQVNPYKAMIAKKDSIEEEINKVKIIRNELVSKYSSLDTLYELSFKLRSVLLEQAILDIQESTNRYLDNYFDSELKISLKIEDSDKLDVIIHKSGYECSYSQLSKGQRGLLKLCFGISIMNLAANNAGQHFDSLYFDEALDGLDTNLKIKAYDLFSELSLTHDSIFVIDHSPELQNMFTSKYKVSLEGDNSIIESSYE